MAHRCDTPSKYSAQFVFGGMRCTVCGQRWINLPDGQYQAEWTKVTWCRWFWIGHGMEVTSAAGAVGILAVLILMRWIPPLP